ncbi:MAG TPA: NAD(P)-dependent oxidoreductase [Acidimicrobiales bacterium]|nr:NAD(P)-dependent oxidoreductase [Acidimicrobiales bacterium]
MSPEGVRTIIVGVPPGGLEIIEAALPPGLPIEIFELPEVVDDFDSLPALEFLVLPLRVPDLVPWLPAMEQLRVVQVLKAGYDGVEDNLPDLAQLCNARGSRDVAVAEWVLGALLGVFSGVVDAAVRQPQREWLRPWRHELAGAKVVVVGMGPIGQAIARRCEALDMRVFTFARSARGSILCVEDLADHLGDADAVILITPLTNETRGLMDASMLARMKDGALLINAGRGPCVDLPALVKEVANGRLRTALDVYDAEPLPPEHPLWSLEGSYVSPHLGGHTREGNVKALTLAASQITRYARGEPLKYVVGQGRGLTNDAGV